MRAKKVEFEVTYITKDSKPKWFLGVSPHGKVPVLKVNNEVLFESNAIAEFLDEVIDPQLAPSNPIERARHRAWTDFTGGWAGALNKVNYAKTIKEHMSALEDLPVTLQKLENALSQRKNNGPYFSGNKLCLVDAAYAPFLMRFNIVETINPSGILEAFPKITAWSDALLTNEYVIGSVSEDFLEVFEANLYKKESLAAKILDARSTTAK
jgi:glutathione S-transferase